MKLPSIGLLAVAAFVIGCGPAGSSEAAAPESDAAFPPELIGTYQVDVSDMEAKIEADEKLLNDMNPDDRQAMADNIAIQKEEVSVQQKIVYELTEDRKWRMTTDGEETFSGEFSFADNVLTLHPDPVKNEELAKFNMAMDDALYDYDPEDSTLTLRADEGKQFRLIKG